MQLAYRTPDPNIVATNSICAVNGSDFGDPVVLVGYGSDDTVASVVLTLTPEDARRLGQQLIASAYHMGGRTIRWIVTVGKMSRRECESYLYSYAEVLRSAQLSEGGKYAHLIAVTESEPDGMGCVTYQAGRLQSQGMVGVHIRDNAADALDLWRNP